METIDKKSIGQLEREMLYCQSKADFFLDLLKNLTPDTGVTVTVGLADTVSTSFQVRDLYSEQMELSLLGAAEELFRMKAKRISEDIRSMRGKVQGFISDGFNA